MIDIGLHERLGIAHRPAMRGPQDRVVAREQFLAGSPYRRAMSPSGGVTTVVDQPIT